MTRRRRRTNLSPLQGQDEEQRFETHRRAVALAKTNAEHYQATAQKARAARGMMDGASPQEQQRAAEQMRAKTERDKQTRRAAGPGPSNPGALTALAERRVAGRHMDLGTAYSRRTTDSSRARIARKFGINPNDPRLQALRTDTPRSFQPVPPGGGPPKPTGTRRLTDPRSLTRPGYPSTGGAQAPRAPTPLPRRVGGTGSGDPFRQLVDARRRIRTGAGRRRRRGVVGTGGALGPR